MIEPKTIWHLLWTVVIVQQLLIAFLVYMLLTLNAKWMRIFCERSGIPLDIMEGKVPSREEVVEPKRKIDHRMRVPAPIPGVDWRTETPRPHVGPREE